jgi:hypothetical protein
MKDILSWIAVSAIALLLSAACLLDMPPMV